MRILYVHYGRFPSEKAGAIYTAAAAEAFKKAGNDIEIWATRRKAHSTGVVPHGVSVRYLPTIDFFALPVLRRIAYFIAVSSFSFSVYRLLVKESADVVISHELLPLFAAALAGHKTLYEVHDFPKNTFIVHALLHRISLFQATNKWKARALHERFEIPNERIFVEPNGVSLEQFDIPLSRAEARGELSLPQDSQIALYTGHLYSWKGVDTLAEAARALPEVAVYFVGGTESDRFAFAQKHGATPNIHIVGHRPHAEMPLWQRAADVLVLPNTAKEEISAQYTSPMKLFEYMASGTPIVASDIPSIQDVVADSEVSFVTADNPLQLARMIEEVLTRGDDGRASRARQKVAEHTWQKRAQRIETRLRG